MAAVSPQENPVTTCGLHIGLPRTGTKTLQHIEPELERGRAPVWSSGIVTRVKEYRWLTER